VSRLPKGVAPRSVSVHVRFKREEAEHYAKLARSKKMTLSEYIRWGLREVAVKDVSP
jgi:hypothetical protein